ncbi:MAG: restriction endonuclease subunit S [Candidatus Omnitrophica bacterium]|nr:restriction endonuclease subunit S [Candidatus Omnitrophota bacterium]
MECFAIDAKDITGRIDAYFYQRKFSVLENALNKISYKKYTLGDLIVDISGGATPKVEENYYADKNTGVPFLRVQNISDEGLILDDVKYISKDVHNTMLKRSQLKKDDLVFTITGRIGSVAVIPEGFEGNINQHSVRFHLKDKIEGQEILPHYIASYLNSNIGILLSNRGITGGTRPALDYEYIKTIQIPLPDLSLQNQVVEIMQSAYSQKKQKEQEAEKLLASIDDYVLEELGIKLPELKERLCFVALSDEVKGNRLDPKKYSERPKAILKAIKKSKFSSTELSKLIVDNISGDWGEENQQNGYILCKVLRNTNFDNRLNLNFDDVAERYVPEEKFKKIKLQNGDILIEKSGGSPIQPVGRVALIENIKGSYVFSNFLQCFRINNEKCLPAYLFSYLRAIYSLNYMEYLQNQTTGIKNLIMEEYLSIPVILPSLEIQQKIADEVRKRMQEAQGLRTEANRLVEEAKRKVEDLILGKA